MNLNNLILSLIIKILPIIISNISPALRETVKQIVLELEKKAKTTQNPFDDMLVELLKVILNIDNN